MITCRSFPLFLCKTFDIKHVTPSNDIFVGCMDTKLFSPHKVTHVTKRKTPKALEFSLNVKNLLGFRRKQYAARFIHLWQELSAVWKRKKNSEARPEEKKKKNL